MAYTKTTWLNGGPPALSAANLNKLETQYDEAKADLETHKAEKATQEKIGHVKADGESTTVGENGVLSAFPIINNIKYKPKIITDNIEILGSSIPYSGVISSIVCDEDYLYVGGEAPSPYLAKVVKIRISDMEVVAESEGINIVSSAGYLVLAQDTQYLYVGGYETRNMKKMRKSDLVVIATGPDTQSGKAVAMTVDENYVFMWQYVSSGDRHIYKLNKSDLSYLEGFVTGGGTGYAITHDDTYIYYSTSTNVVVKRNKSDLSTIVATSGTYGGTIRGILADGDYLYIFGETANVVQKLNKSNLEIVAIGKYGGHIYSGTLGGDAIYIGGSGQQNVVKLEKNNLTKIAESQQRNYNIKAVAGNNENIFCGGGALMIAEKFANIKKIGYTEVV